MTTVTAIRHDYDPDRAPVAHRHLLTVRDQLQELWEMTAAQRVEAMWRGQLTSRQLSKWSSRAPGEVPLLGNEFAWIAMRMPEWGRNQPARPHRRGAPPRTQNGSIMTAVPNRARELAGRLAVLFAQDSEIAERLSDAQSCLQDANRQLWSGLHPDALALLYDNTHAVGIAPDGRIRSKVKAVMIDQLRCGADEQQLETAVLAAVQEIHWTIHRAFLDYQSATEERRKLAVDVGELAQQLTDTLTPAGWTETEARNANVNHLAEGRGDHVAR